MREHGVDGVLFGDCSLYWTEGGDTSAEDAGIDCVPGVTAADWRSPAAAECWRDISEFGGVRELEREPFPEQVAADTPEAASRLAAADTPLGDIGSVWVRDYLLGFGIDANLAEIDEVLDRQVARQALIRGALGVNHPSALATRGDLDRFIGHVLVDGIHGQPLVSDAEVVDRRLAWLLERGDAEVYKWSNDSNGNVVLWLGPMVITSADRIDDVSFGSVKVEYTRYTPPDASYQASAIYRRLGAELARELPGEILSLGYEVEGPGDATVLLVADADADSTERNQIVRIIRFVLDGPDSLHRDYREDQELAVSGGVLHHPYDVMHDDRTIGLKTIFEHPTDGLSGC
jgi:hypothetical protein